MFAFLKLYQLVSLPVNHLAFFVKILRFCSVQANPSIIPVGCTHINIQWAFTTSANNLYPKFSANILFLLNWFLFKRSHWKIDFHRYVLWLHVSKSAINHCNQYKIKYPNLSSPLSILFLKYNPSSLHTYQNTHSRVCRWLPMFKIL